MKALEKIVLRNDYTKNEEIPLKNRLSIKTETNDNNPVFILLLKIIKNVDSCGIFLKDLVKKDLTRLNLLIWLMTLEIWGSFNEASEYFACDH